MHRCLFPLCAAVGGFLAPLTPADSVGRTLHHNEPWHIFGGTMGPYMCCSVNAGCFAQAGSCDGQDEQQYPSACNAAANETELEHDGNWGCYSSSTCPYSYCQDFPAGEEDCLKKYQCHWDPDDETCYASIDPEIEKARESCWDYCIPPYCP